MDAVHGSVAQTELTLYYILGLELSSTLFALS